MWRSCSQKLLAGGDVDLVGADSSLRVSDIASRGDVEFPIVPRAPNDLPVAGALQPVWRFRVGFVGSADVAQTQWRTFVRAVVDDRVQRPPHVVHAHAELPDVDQLHRTRRQLIEGAHQAAFQHGPITASLPIMQVNTVPVTVTTTSRWASLLFIL